VSLEEKLTEDMKAAMKAREEGKRRLSVIRMVRAAVKNTEIEKGQKLNDQQIIEVIVRELKMKRESIEGFARAGRTEKVQELEEEAAILQEYLPQQLSDEEIRQIVLKAIAEAQAQSPADLGKVMKIVAPSVKGRADGKVVNEMVRKLLNP